MLSENLGERTSKIRIPVRQAVRDCTEYSLGMAIPLKGTIEAEEAAKTAEFSEVYTNRMGDRRLASPSASEEEAHLMGIRFVDPSNELVQRMPTSALKTSLARIESGASNVSQVKQVNRCVFNRQ